MGIASESASWAPAVTEGTELAGRYVLRRSLAAGGMAQVWEADDAVLGRPVAVKVLHPHLSADPSLVERFRAEAKAAARLSHQSIVAIYDTASQDGIEAIVMELIDGLTLRQYLDEYGPLTLEDAGDLTAQVAAALEAAHAARIVHRDIKPGNIMLCPDRRVKVTDFGIAKALEEGDRTTQGTLLGTAKYLAPEQVEGTPVDQRADIYSLGVVIYEALTGTPPFDAETDSATALARLRVDPRPPSRLNPSITPPVEAVILTALARDREDRYPTADAMGVAMIDALSAPPNAPSAAPVVDPTLARPVPHSAATPADTSDSSSTRPPRRVMGPVLVSILIAGCLALGVGLVLATGATRGFFDKLFATLGGNDSPETPDTDAVGPDPDPTALAGSDPDTDASTGELGGETANANGADGHMIVDVIDFDPLGDEGERPEKLVFATDDDPNTLWTSEGYDNRALGNLKEGVGLVLVLDSEVTLRELAVVSPTQGWAASVYATGAPAADLLGWGDSLDGRIDIAGDATFDLRGVRGAAVLLWITDLGDAPPQLRIEIAEVSLS